jgi:hypothetical protein
METFLAELNSNPVFMGLLLILMNIGSRFIMVDIPDSIEEIFKSVFARSFVVFAILFISSRDILLSLIMTIVFYILMKYLLNPKSKSCVLPQKEKYLKVQKPASFVKDIIPTSTYEKAKKLVQLYETEDN